MMQSQPKKDRRRGQAAGRPKTSTGDYSRSECIDALRHDQDALLDELRAAGAQITNPKTFRCPFHDDTTPSAGIHNGTDDGHFAAKCFGCEFSGDVFDVMAHNQGRPVTDVIRDYAAEHGGHGISPRAKPKARITNKTETFESLDAAIARTWQGWKPTAQYRYTDDFVTVRRERGAEKKVLPYFRSGARWAQKFPEGKRPLYRERDAIEHDTIFVPEGEKCCDLCWSIGIPAVACSGGVGSARSTDWSALKGKTVTVMPDHIDGERLADDIATIGAEVGFAVKVLLLPGLVDEGDDIEQFIGDHRSKGMDDTTISREVLDLAESLPCVPVADDAVMPAPVDDDDDDDVPEAWIPQPLSCLQASAEPEWYWEGILAGGCMSQFIGIWKGGKTTILAHVLREMANGGEVGGRVRKCRVLVVSEEAELHWVRRREKLSLGDHIQVICRPFKSRPSLLEWCSFIAHLKRLCRETMYTGRHFRYCVEVLASRERERCLTGHCCAVAF